MRGRCRTCVGGCRCGCVGGCLTTAAGGGWIGDCFEEASLRAVASRSSLARCAISRHGRQKPGEVLRVTSRQAFDFDEVKLKQKKLLLLCLQLVFSM